MIGQVGGQLIVSLQPRTVVFVFAQNFQSDLRLQIDFFLLLKKNFYEISQAVFRLAVILIKLAKLLLLMQRKQLRTMTNQKNKPRYW